MITRPRFSVLFVFALVGLLLMFMVNGASAQGLTCPVLGAGAEKIVVEVQGDPNAPYIAEVRGGIPEWGNPAPYVVIPEGAENPPRLWLDPHGFLYSFARIDWNGWGYYLIPDEDPYIVQPTAPDFSDWYQFQNPEAVEAFRSIALTDAYQGWWSDDTYDAPIGTTIVALWYVYDQNDDLIEYGMVWDSDDGALLYPARWTSERFDEPYPEDEFKHPVCWNSMSLDALDQFKQLVLTQRAAWAAR